MSAIMVLRRTLEDKLSEAGKPYDIKVNCPVCGRSCLPFELVDVSNTPSIPDDDICGHCLTDIDRNATLLSEEAAKSQTQTWDDDEGANVRAERSKLLDLSLWAVMPGTPLSEACQKEFCDYRRKLHRLTVDFEYPGDVVWPNQPELVYEG